MKHDKFDRFHVIKTSSIVFLIFLVFYNSKYMTHGQTQRRINRRERQFKPICHPSDIEIDKHKLADLHFIWSSNKIITCSK